VNPIGHTPALGPAYRSVYPLSELVRQGRTGLSLGWVIYDYGLFRGEDRGLRLDEPGNRLGGFRKPGSRPNPALVQEHHDHVGHAQERREGHVNHAAGGVRPGQAFHIDRHVRFLIKPDKV
jgi:hypothetical protein